MDNFDIETHDDSKEIWLFFLVTTFLSQILIMNMLINMTGEALGQLMEEREEISLRATIRLLYDNNAISFKSTREKFMFVIETDESKNGDNTDNIQARIKSVKRDVTMILKGQSDHHNTMHEEIKDAIEKSAALEEKFDNFQHEQVEHK